MEARERALRKLCREYGLVCDRQGRAAHFKVIDPASGQTVATASGTSGDARMIKNLRAQLRKYRLGNSG